jgi:hypothetical protein
MLPLGAAAHPPAGEGLVGGRAGRGRPLLVARRHLGGDVDGLAAPGDHAADDLLAVAGAVGQRGVDERQPRSIARSSARTGLVVVGADPLRPPIPQAP